MSFKAKDLHYESREPAFIQRLKRQFNSGEVQRQEPSQARPKREREDDEEDEPVYVDEESNQTLSRVEYEALKGGLGKVEPDDQPADTDIPTAAKDNDMEPQAGAEQQKATIGARKKQSKPIKTFGDDDGDKRATEQPKPQSTKTSKTKSKKGKKIKLSFDEDEAD